LLYKLRVDEVDDLLQAAVQNTCFKGLSTQASVAFRTLVTLGWDFFEVLKDTALTEGAQALVDGVSISQKSFAQITLQERIERALQNQFIVSLSISLPLVLLFHGKLLLVHLNY
jgi:hypothetical protein